MDIQDALDFIALAQTRSFSRAAELRHVTQPAFSRRVRALEQSLKLDLVNRSQTPLALTPAGQQFLRHAHNLAAVYDQASLDMKSLATNLPDAVHLVTGRSLANGFFPAWYRGMQARVKGLTMRLSNQRSATGLDSLRAGLADFSLQIMAGKLKRLEDYSDLEQAVIGRDRLMLVRAPDAPENAIMLYRPGSYMTVCTETMLGPRLARMKVVFESQATEFARAMAIAGFGTALLPEGLITAELEQGLLLPAVPNVKPLAAQIMLVRARHQLSKHAEAVWKVTQSA